MALRALAAAVAAEERLPITSRPSWIVGNGLDDKTGIST